MGMMKRDYLILRYVEEHGAITPEECAKLFFKGCKGAHKLALIRLRQLFVWGKLKRFQEGINGQLQYYWSKRATPHFLKLMDYYALLVDHDINIINFDPEYHIDTPGYKSKIPFRKIDGVFEIEKDGFKQRIFVEVDDNHRTSIQKLEEVAAQLFVDKFKAQNDKGVYDYYYQSFVVIKSNPIHGKPMARPYDRQCYYIDMKKDINKKCFKYLTKSYEMSATYLPWDFYECYDFETSYNKRAVLIDKLLQMHPENRAVYDDAMACMKSERERKSRMVEKSMEQIKEEIKNKPYIIYL